MVRAQKRGMGKMRERTARPKRQNYRRTRKQIFRGSSGGGGLGALWACSGADISRGRATPTEHREPRVGERKRSREGQGGKKMEGGGDKDGGTTLVIGSLATVG